MFLPIKETFLWDLNLILSALLGPPLEPIASSSLLHLSVQLTFLIAVTSANGGDPSTCGCPTIQCVLPRQGIHENTPEISLQSSDRIPPEPADTGIVLETSCSQN